MYVHFQGGDVSIRYITIYKTENSHSLEFSVRERHKRHAWTEAHGVNTRYGSSDETIEIMRNPCKN